MRRGRWLWLLIPLQLSPLLFYKYGGFLGNDILGLESRSFTNVIIPVGISFYTFQLISFAVDTLKRSHPLPSPLNTLNFAGFFPQIVAGPIERREALLPQLEKFRFRWDKKAIEIGLTWMILGLFFKRCLADNFAQRFTASTEDYLVTSELKVVIITDYGYICKVIRIHHHCHQLLEVAVIILSVDIVFIHFVY